MRYLLLTVIILIMGCKLGEKLSFREAQILWYNQPANALAWQAEHPSFKTRKSVPKAWDYALPVGNGRLGAMVYGGIEKEIIQVNEDTIWEGGPISEIKDSENFKVALQQTRNLLFQEKYQEAENILARAMPKRISPRSYQPLGEIILTNKQHTKVSNYRRQLSLDDAIATTSYKYKNTTFMRQTFASYPNDVLVTKLSAISDSKVMEKINTTVSFQRQLIDKIIAKGNTIYIYGQAKHIDANTQKEVHHGVSFTAKLQISTDGEIAVGDDKKSLIIKGASESLILLVVNTDYNFKDVANPLRYNRGIACDDQLDAAFAKGFDKLKQENIEAHQKLFHRVSFKLGKDPIPNKPIDQRLLAFAKTQKDDPNLIQLYYQFGRYLLISSSRPKTMPANLQGIWNREMGAPWNSDYHTNINFQMNYWPVLSANLAELHTPYFDFIDELEDNNKDYGEKNFGVKGFVAHHATDGNLKTVIYGKPQYGAWFMGAAWATRQYMEHYNYTKDKAFLENRAYPILRKASTFLSNWLVIHPKTGRLVSGPSTSPENAFLDKKGKKSTISMGNAMDQQIIWDTFRNYLQVAQILQISDSLTKKITKQFDNLANPGIGQDGRLLEWQESLKEALPGHRHISHLYAVYPSNQYTYNTTPREMVAASKTLEHRLKNGGGHTGWSRAWIINFYARLKNSAKVYENINTLLSKSTLPNLLDTHPPYQIDGNLGGIAGLMESLVQSHDGGLEFMPAFPLDKWRDGSIAGIRARNGFECSLTWQDGKLLEVTITSLLGEEAVILLNDSITQQVEVIGVKSSINNNKLTFSTEKGKTYKLIINQLQFRQ